MKNKIKFAQGLVAGLAAGAAAGYFLSDKKRRLRFQRQIALTKEQFDDIVDTVLTKYERTKKLSTAELTRIAGKLKACWEDLTEADDDDEEEDAEAESDLTD